MNRIWSAKRGTTLVEILVVMVVLLIGIMTVIQMFPTGFRVVRAAESRTIASKLAEGEIERWKNMPANLPTAILPIDDTGAVINTQYPGPPFTDFTDAGGGIYGRGNVLNIRQIYGETTVIPVPSYFQFGGGTAYGSQYTLAFSPIDVHDNGDGTYDGLVVKSGELQRRRGDHDFSPPYLRQGQYAIAFDEGGGAQFYVAFPRYPGNGSSPAPVYYINYSYWVENSGKLEMVSVIDQPVDLSNGGSATSYDGDWVTVPVNAPAGFNGVEPDTDTCARGFRPRSGPWSKDPYEYYLADPYLGIIAFNPTGYGRYERTASGVKPLSARVDYRIYDPRILREDRVIPQPAPGATEIPIKLALRFILDAGDPANLNDGDPTDNPDEPTFEGLIRAVDVGGVPKLTLGVPLSEGAYPIVNSSVMIIDLASGLRLDMSAVSIDHAAGVVHLPLEADFVDWDGNHVEVGASLAGKHLRFFYRADGDWSVQCSKAYTNYARDWGIGKRDPDFEHYTVINNRTLTFAACHGGQTVAVDYTFSLDGEEHKIVGESHRISDDTFDCDLNYPAGADLVRIYAVVGTSFRARVIWRDGRNWRYVDMDTNLTRTSSQQ